MVALLLHGDVIVPFGLRRLAVLLAVLTILWIV